MPSSSMSWAADHPVPLERRIVTIRSSGTCKVVDKGKIERLVGELPRYTKIVVLFKRINDECMIPKTNQAMLALQLLC